MFPDMTNLFGIALDQASLRWAAAEGVSETVIAAVLQLHERSVDEIAAKITPQELADVTRLVSRCPSCYPPGAYDALKAKRNLASPAPPTQNLPSTLAAKEQTATTGAGPRTQRRPLEIGRAHV
jgi:hypothetical protein